MKAKNLLSMIQNNPEAEIIMREQSYEVDAFNEVSTAHFYRKGDVVFERGENFTDFICDETAEALVDIIVLS